MKIAVVGAGKGGSNLIKVFQTMNDVKVVVVVDNNPQAEGVKLAKSYGITWESDIENIGGYSADVIVEATGSNFVIGKLRELYSHNHQIMDAQMAQVLNQMVDGQVALLDKMSMQMQVIQRLTATFKGEFDQLVGSVERINALSGHLNLAVDRSNSTIIKTDEMTNAVNKIAMQTKILGLNANIEAARAGEHGKGFAVVASEVQKLSDSSTQSATEISELLKELTAEIQKVNDAARELDMVSGDQRSTANMLEKAILELGSVL